MGSLYRDIEHFSAEYIGGADASGYHGCPCSVGAGIRSLGPAQSEFHDAVSLGRVDDALCLGGNEALVIDDIEQRCLDELGLHNGGNDLDKGFPGENHGTLRNGVNIACKAEFIEIAQKVLLKHIQASQVFNVAVIKMQVLNVLNDLLQSSTDGKAVAVGIGPVKHVEYNGFVGVLFFEIPLHHG